MKKILLSLSFLILTSNVLLAQDSKYVSAMKANITAMDTSFTYPDNFINIANNFERIGLAEKDKWLPYYFASLCVVNNSFMQPDKSKVDELADRAAALLDKASALVQNNSEISCLRSMIASTRLMVNPMQRYMEYGTASAAELEKAIAEDPTNPRPYYLKGQALKYTPAQFGGGCPPAMEQLNIAMEKFKTFKPASEISPNWGKSSTERVMNECR